MPKIKMTIDLEIADGLFIKISAEGAVSIHKEEEAPLKIVPPAKLGRRRHGIGEVFREKLLEQKASFTLKALFPVKADQKAAFNIAKKLVAEGKLKLVRPGKALGPGKGSLPGIYGAI